jgi:hypothetical protein
MQNSKVPIKDITRELAGITDILESLAKAATPETKAEIEWARQILLNTSAVSVLRNKGALSETPTSDEKIVTRHFEITSFENVEIDCAFIFDIRRGDVFGISIETGESLIDCVNITQSGDTLRLSMKPVRLTARPIIKARIVMPAINRLRQSAATRGTVTGFKSDNLFDLYLSGASSIFLDIESQDARLEVSGASTINGNLDVKKADILLSGASRGTLSGKCENLSLSAWGAAEIDMQNFCCETGIVYLKGASQAVVRILKQLDIDMTGASHLKYVGDPLLKEITLTGASILGKAE